jgi:hypothetical protein
MGQELNGVQKAALGCYTVGVGLVLLIVGGCVVIALSGNRDGDGHTPGQVTSSNREKEVEAYVMAQKYVEQRLVSPGSAKWPWGEFTVFDQGNGVYRVQGYLDAQNRFGALVRIQYVALMRDELDGTWKCLQVDIQER